MPLIMKKTINGQPVKIRLTADTGAGAPVGSIIVVCSNILPSGYLGLGVQYDITNYPALYQVLGTDTTPTASALGLPTLSSGQYAIKATSGLTENQQENVLNTINENLSYSTTEHKTGRKWIDGKDTYQAVVENITVTTNWGAITDIGNVVDSLINVIPVLTAGNVVTNVQKKVDNNFIYLAKSSSDIVESTKFIFEYTKTTDN